MSEREAPIAEPPDGLPAAGMSADRGLASLGLLMQLAGGALAACGGLLALRALVELRELRAGPPGQAVWVLAAVGLCVARSLVHRAAGAELLYGGRRRADGTTASPLDGVRRYVAVALGQTVLLALVCRGGLGMSTGEVLACSTGLAVWPLALGGLLASGALARYEAQIPHGEDKGFEGASILMAVLGAAGALATAAILAAELRAALERGYEALVQGPGVVVIGVLGILLVRAALHVRAGLGGLAETSLDRSVERAKRYADFGVVSSMWVAGVLLLAAMSHGLNVWGMALVAGLCWLMTMWPLAVRRFFCDRQFADLIAGDRAAPHRRAPDAGLTGLGWLLVGHAALTASLLVPQLVAGPALAGDARWLASLAAGVGDGSPWWSAGVVVLEAWAGTELVRMGAHHRLLAAAYGAAGTLVTLLVMGPLVDGAMAAGSLLDGSGDRLVMSLALIALQLAIPAAAVLLATRTIAPAARARYRRGAAGKRRR